MRQDTSAPPPGFAGPRRLRQGRSRVSQPGDLWLLGQHRVFCGDSLKEETYNASWRAATPCSGGLRWGALATLSLLLYVPALQNLFRVAPLSPAGLLVCATAAALSVAGFEILKLWRRPHRTGA